MFVLIPKPPHPVNRVISLFVFLISKFKYFRLDISNGTGTLPRRTDISNMDVPLIKPRVLSPSRIVNAKRALPKDMEDLIHLPGPLTEDAVMRTLQARFGDGKHFVSTMCLLLVLRSSIE